MKIKLLLLLLTIVSTINTFADNNKIKGNGKIVSQEVTIPDFSNIQVDDLSVNINYEQSESESPYLKFEIDENLIDYISFKVNGNTLTISKSDEKINLNYKELKVYTNSKNLSVINSTGVINLDVKNPISSTKFSLYNIGISNINIQNITVDTINLESSGIGNIVIKGSANSLFIDSSGKTAYKTDGLKAKNVNILSSGMDNIKVWAIDAIDAQADGMCKIRYKGNPSRKEFSKSGFSSIKEIK